MAVHDLADTLHDGGTILGMKQVMAMDATGLRALEELHLKFQRRKQCLLLAGPHTQPLMMMTKGGFLKRLGTENVCENMDTALERARALVSEEETSS